MAPPWFPLINFTIEKEFSKHFSGNSNFVQDLLHSAPLLSEDFPRNSRFLPEPLVEGIPSPADSKCSGDGYYHIGNKSGVDRVLGTPVFLECNPHSSSTIIFGVQSTLQSTFIFGVRSDALQAALQFSSWNGVLIVVLPLRSRTPIHISLCTPIQNMYYFMYFTHECRSPRNAECGVWSMEGVR